MKFPFWGMMSAALIFGAASCSDDNDPEPAGGTEGVTDATMAKTIQTYVDSVVVSTYAPLADTSMLLYAACLEVKKEPTQANIDKACLLWKSARKWWEQSEAFLYGAAAEYNIDPHIDSWPLDKPQLDNILANKEQIANMEQYGCKYDRFIDLGYGVEGFHAIEYILFRDGGPRKAEGGTDADGVKYGELSSAELAYCATVAEDMRNQCIRLEASWKGMENISDEKQAILADMELEPALDYGEQMESAGEKGNAKYKTQVEAYTEILQGASDIADEVANTKITDPVNSQNVLKVESWYSWNSITDFADNIRSVQHAYNGCMETTPVEASISAYIKSIDPALDSDLQASIANAVKEVEAMPAPFRKHLGKSEFEAALNACNDLKDKLDQAIELINK